MSKKQKLELTWVGKENKPNLEPRILIEDATKTYHAVARVTENDIFENALIHGDNLLALKALEADYAGKIKCVFIDPPYNTGSAFLHYDDGLEHSIWLGLMRDRLEIIRRLLSDDGSLWITIDSNESAYLKVLCDEIFGRHCYVETIAWRNSDSSNNNAKRVSLDHNDILLYSKRPEWEPKFLDDPARRKHFKNPDNDPRGPWFDGNNMQNPALRPNLQYTVISPSGYEIPHPPNGWRWSRETLEAKMATGEIRFTPDGKGLRRRTYLADMVGLPPSSLWISLEETGHNRQAKYELKTLFPDVPVTSLFGTPKPERLVNRVLELATNPGDLVLDSFAGSGTTGSVAHKMGRRWIMVELGDHCTTHIVPRLQKVIDGTDQGGISKAVEWKGGGGFRYYELAPSLLEKDKWGREVISKEYNPAMLAQALCKLEGFTYEPSPDVYWQQGHSSEADFLYVTTQTLGPEELAAISEDVGEGRSLLILCAAFRGNAELWPNLTIRKIPNHIRSRCEWGHDDYSLNVSNLPMAEPKRRTASPQPGLFDEGDAS